MLNPIIIQTRIVDLLQAIPELVAILGDSASVEGYDDESQVSGDPEVAEFT